MKKLKLVVSLPNENSYQLEQARTAKEKASQLGADIRIIFAENDAVTQSQQVLEIVQSRTERLDAILFEPLTATALARVGEAAVDAGIGWIVLNCDVEYLETLRQRAKAPVFAVTRDHTEIGRIQGKQFAALLPRGGTILYIQGPATSLAAVQRSVGMEIELRHLAPTPLGGSVTCTTRVIQAEGALITFQVEARDAHELIARGLHKRAVIRVGSFSRRVARKASSPAS